MGSLQLNSNHRVEAAEYDENLYESHEEMLEYGLFDELDNRGIPHDAAHAYSALMSTGDLSDLDQDDVSGFVRDLKEAYIGDEDALREHLSELFPESELPSWAEYHYDEILDLVSQDYVQHDLSEYDGFYFDQR